MAHKYGNKEDISRYINLDDQDDPDKVSLLIDTALMAADVYVDSVFENEGIPLPIEQGGTYPLTIIQAATFYAMATLLQSNVMFSSYDEENMKAPFYLAEAEKFINRYIGKKVNEEYEDSINPYKVSKTKVNRNYL